MTAQNFISKLKSRAWEIKKIIFFDSAFNMLILFLLLASISYCVSGVSVSVILEDKTHIKNENITHEITAYNDVYNITIIDYFSDVKVSGIDVKNENFMGKEWRAVKIDVGNMKKDERKTITYKILSGKGEAMLGGDIYFLEGEMHRLFPEKTTIEVISGVSNPGINDGSINESIDIGEQPNQNYPAHILVLAAIVVGAIMVLIVKKLLR